MHHLKHFALRLLDRANRRSADARNLRRVRPGIQDYDASAQELIATVLREIAQAAVGTALQEESPDRAAALALAKGADAPENWIAAKAAPPAGGGAVHGA